MRFLTKEVSFINFGRRSVQSVSLYADRQMYQQSASLCGWLTNVLFACHIVTQFSSAVTPIMSLPVMHIIEQIERASLSKTFFVVYYTMQDGCTGHCALYKFGSLRP